MSLFTKALVGSELGGVSSEVGGCHLGVKRCRGSKVAVGAAYAYYKVSTSTALKTKKELVLFPKQQPFKIEHGGGGGNNGNNRYITHLSEGDDEDEDFSSPLVSLTTLSFLAFLARYLRPLMECIALWSSSVVLADVLAQLLCFHSQTFDVSRTLKLAQYCGLVRGPAVFFLTLCLGRFYGCGASSLLRNIALDLGPAMGVLCGCYSFFYPLIEGKGWKGGQESIKSQFIPSLGNAYRYWPAIYLTKYTIIKQKYALMYLLGADFLYALLGSQKSLSGQKVGLRFTYQKSIDLDFQKLERKNKNNVHELVFSISFSRK
eukprot:TRINITY_DN1888_c0_g2_i1.p1 TRINITY_DN1888_c0_g2~~TRINITY_DN1888_c0_g2_i1.p1  ORF type:complete len:318 (-),score=39.79 TRINITY_DN1888_c0_g2_i1:214-1167(-)